MSGRIERIWVIGGYDVYKTVLESPYLYRIYITNIYKWYDCDLYFPSLRGLGLRQVTDPDVPSPESVCEENGIAYSHVIYERYIMKENKRRSSR